MTALRTALIAVGTILSAQQVEKPVLRRIAPGDPITYSFTVYNPKIYPTAVAVQWMDFELRKPARK